MSRASMTEDDVADLSDDEIMGMVSAPLMEGSPDDVATGSDDDSADAETVSAAAAAEPDDADDDQEAAGSDGHNDAVDDADTDPAADPADDLDDEEFEKAPAKVKAAKPKADVPADNKAAAETPAKKAAADLTPTDYKAAYDALMAPFKANGKEVRIDTPEDAVRLMQMGANYTKKLQGLAPGLRILKMLEKNGLMDESKIGRLIDLEKKDPAAIKQMIKDSGVDPMDIDTTQDTGYKPGNYRVSDEEMRFTSTVEEVASDPVGKDLVTTIHQTWDKQSKDALWQDPEILRILTQQRKSGIYGQINAEVERRKTLGYVTGDTPFLTAYQTVGQDLERQGLLKTSTAAQPAPNPGANGQPAPVAAPARKVLDQRTGLSKPGPTVSNSDKARAASPAKGVPAKKGAVDFNPLSMSDEDFEKNADLAKRL